MNPPARLKRSLPIAAAILGLVVAAIGAADALACTRPVAVITVFAGAFGAGAAFAAAVRGRMAARSERRT